jgi:trk system potassium uptake protein TrkH
VLVLTAVLLIVGTLFLYAVESNGALAGLSEGEKISASFFMSVNSRSSGFTSFNPNDMRPISKAFIVLLMFIGGASGSTAGGIKINTLGIMIIAILCVIRSQEDTIFLKKRIPRQVVLKAFSITLLAGIMVVALTFLLNLIQPELSLIDALFESVSGFATVGLSTGITPSLATGNKLLLIFSMFAGRVGPLSFGLAFSMMKRENRNTVLSRRKFIVG